MGRIGISQSHTHSIPWEVVNDDQSIISDQNVVLNKWKEAFEELLNTNVVSADTIHGEMLGEYPVLTDTTSLNEPITIDEVRFALTPAKKGKAVGEDGIPMEVLQNKECIAYLVYLYNACFETASIPDVWSHGIIHPIIKDSKNDIIKDFKNDHRDPFHYRGITITSVTYKLYCSILNNRLSRLLELNDGLADEQNGFRRGRCTGDHITIFSMIVKSRIKLKRDTFASFIDFSKAYDRIDRSLLWHKLSRIGIDGKMLRSLKSLYENVKCTVRVNGVHSEWFDVNTGL